MNEKDFAMLQAQMADLSPEQFKSLVQTYAKANGGDTRREWDKSIFVVSEQHLVDLGINRACPACGSIAVVHNGLTDAGIQRFRCQDCGRSFTRFTGTLLEKSRFPWEVWVEVLRMTLNDDSLETMQTLWECGYTGGSMSQISDCLDLLRQLVAIPSESQNEEAHARFLADYLKDELEMETQLQHVEGKSYNVTGCWHPIKGKARRKLMLGGHLDTVSPTDLWETDPYRLVQQGDQLHGLGAGDMKGGLAAQLMVLKSLKEQGGLWDAEVEFVGLADEERHSVGANAYVRRVQEEKQPQPETFFIMAEPHFDNIVVGATGKVLLKLEVTGAPGHAAMPEKGINAVDCMAALLQAVNQTWGSCYREGRVGSHCCLMIHSDYPGYSLNIPQRCTCLINKQLMAEERGEDFLEDLKRIYEKAVGQGTLRVTRQIPSYPSYQLPKNQPDLAALHTLLKQRFQRVPELKINQSVSDGNILYQSLGIPTILYGPRGVDFHTEREYLSCSSLEQYMEELEAYIKTRYAGA